MADERHLLRHDSEGIPIEAVGEAFVRAPVPAPKSARVAYRLLHAYLFASDPIREWTFDSGRVQPNEAPNKATTNIVPTFVARDNSLLLKHAESSEMIARYGIERRIEQLGVVDPLLMLHQLQHSLEAESYVDRMAERVHQVANLQPVVREEFRTKSANGTVCPYTTGVMTDLESTFPETVEIGFGVNRDIRDWQFEFKHNVSPHRDMPFVVACAEAEAADHLEEGQVSPVAHILDVVRPDTILDVAVACAIRLLESGLQGLHARANEEGCWIAVRDDVGAEVKWKAILMESTANGFDQASRCDIASSFVPTANILARIALFLCDFDQPQDCSSF